MKSFLSGNLVPSVRIEKMKYTDDMQYNNNLSLMNLLKGKCLLSGLIGVFSSKQRKTCPTCRLCSHLTAGVSSFY